MKQILLLLAMVPGLAMAGTGTSNEFALDIASGVRTEENIGLLTYDTWWQGVDNADYRIKVNGEVLSTGSGTGTVAWHPRRAGDYALTYEAFVDGVKVGTDLSAMFQITGQDLYYADITLSATEMLYDGTARTPSVTVVYRSETLVEGVDYTLSYTNNVLPGVATITISGMGRFEDIVDCPFTIRPAGICSLDIESGTRIAKETESLTHDAAWFGDPSSSYKMYVDGWQIAEGVGVGAQTWVPRAVGDHLVMYRSYSGEYLASDEYQARFHVTGRDLVNATIKFEDATILYDGTERRPRITLTLGGKTLVEGVDYSLAYSNNINPGVGIITVTGLGSYVDILDVPFTIRPAGVCFLDIESGTRSVVGPVPLCYDASWNGDTNTTTRMELLSEKDGGAATTLASSLTGVGQYDFAPDKDASYKVTLNTYVDEVLQPGEKIYTATFNYTVPPKPIPETKVAVTGYAEVYDGSGHGITVTVDPSIENPTIRYAFAATGPYVPELLLTNVCAATTIWSEVSASGYYPSTNSATVTITARTGVTVTITGKTKTVTYTGAVQSVSGYDFATSDPLYKATDFEFTGTAEAAGTDAATYQMSLDASQFANTNGNFSGVTFTVTDGWLKIKNSTIGPGGGEEPGPGEIPQGGLSKFDATYIYDGEGHTINTQALYAVTLAGATPSFSFVPDVGGLPGGQPLPADGAAWSAVAPTYTNVGEYVVWYRITAPNYSNYVHAAKVTILAKPYEECCLTFTSTSAFSFSQNCWVHDGTLQYSTDGNTWRNWNGDALSAVKNADDKFVLMVRGHGNTYMQGKYSSPALIGTNVNCVGNIETLLDYRKVARGLHPEMGSRDSYSGCFEYLFKQCPALISAPQLPATNLSDRCYQGMFDGCSSLRKAPDLPATVLTSGCYDCMFRDCSSLCKVPSLPAKTLTHSCYYNMFARCYSLRDVPELPGTNLVNCCYTKMFAGCTNICLVAQGEGESWSLPTNAVVQCAPLYPANWQIDMFLGCDIDFVTGPQPGTTYYFKRKPITPDGLIDSDLKTGRSSYAEETVYDGVSHTIITNRLLQLAYEYKRTIPMRSGHIVYDYRDLDTNVYGEVSVLTNKNLTFSYSLTSNGVYQAEPFAFKDVVATSYWYKITSPGFADYLHQAQVVITNRPVTLTSASDSKKYDGEALTNHTVTVGGLGWAPNEGATYEVTGSQTIVGLSANTFGYTLNENTKEANYAVTKVEGTLTVEKKGTEPGGPDDPEKPDPAKPLPPGAVSKFDAIAMYDGTGHTIDTNKLVKAFGDVIVGEFTVQFAVGGDHLSAPHSGLPGGQPLPWSNVSPTFTNACEEIVWYKVTNPNYEDYVHAAKVTITNRPITVKSASGCWVYDMTAHSTNGVEVAGVGEEGTEGTKGTEGTVIAGLIGDDSIVASGFTTITDVGSKPNAFEWSFGAGTLATNYCVSCVTGTLVVVEGEAIVGRFVRIPLLCVVSELKIPEGGVVSAAKFDGVSKGLALVQDRATGVWYVEGVPTEVQDYLTQPMFVRVTVTVGSTKSVVLCPLELRIREAEPMAFRSGHINVPYSGSFVTSFWPSAAVDTKNWKITGWPSGIKCNLSSNPITGKDSKTKAVVTMALPYEVYGKPTKAGRFTVKVTHKVVSASKKSYTENYTADFLVETDKGAIRYSDQAYVALTRTLDADVVSVSGQPSGLKADAKTHQVSGTPTKAGVFVTTYKRTDPTNAKKTISDIFLWEITPGENDGILHRIGWKDAEVEERCVRLEQGEPYQFLVDVPMGAKVTASGLPFGLSMKAVVTNAATKAKATLIAGIPSAVADYVATFKTVMNGVTVTERVAMRVGNSTKIPVPAEYGPFTPGVFASVDLMSFADCKVTGLPTGMKLVSFVDKTSKKTLKYAAEGVPTAYGRFVVTFTKTVDKVKYVAVSTFVVSDYPEIPLAVRLASKRTDGGWVMPGETLTFYCGVRQDFALDFIGLEGVETTINQKGLPTGLKLIKTITNKTTKAFCCSIGGVPTAASTIKNGNLVASKVVLTASNKYKWHGTFSFDIVVLSLPEWARGTYNGGSDAGQVTLTIADKTGKLSGKQLEDGIVRTLTVESYSATDEGTNFTADVTASWSYKDGKSTVKTNEIWFVAVSEGAVGGIVDSAHFTAWQNRWSLQPWKDLGVVLFGKSGTEVCLRGAEYGLKDEELVTLTIKANGTVTTKGVFDLGTLDAKGNRVFYTVSGSTMVSVQSANPFRGLVFVYFPSNVSKGFSGYSQVVPLDEPFD